MKTSLTTIPMRGSWMGPTDDGTMEMERSKWVGTKYQTSGQSHASYPLICYGPQV